MRHVSRWSANGHCPEFSGGGLIRSAGGWRAVKEAYWEGIRLRGDERILGSSEFVETALKAAGEAYDRRMQLHSVGIDLSVVIAAVCRYYDTDEKVLSGPTRRPMIAGARALIGHIASRELSIPASEVARRLNVDRSAISRAVQRVRKNAELMAAARTIMEPLKSAINQQ